MKILLSLIFSIFVLVQNLYALRTESIHFIFYYEIRDSSIIDSVKFKLEDNYGRITGDLKLTILSKIVVHIEQKQYQLALTNYQKSVEIDPDYINGKQRIDVLKKLIEKQK